MTSKYDVLLRLLLVGDTHVGKTCLLCRYTSDEYIDTHITTLGIDFKTKLLPFDNKIIKAQIWDTAGQERFESISRQFYRKAQGIFIVYDISNATTFKSVEKWVSYIHELTVEKPTLLLIGNKSDEENPREVEYNDAKEVAETHNMKFFEVSAKNSDNITEAFTAMISEVIAKHSPLEESGIYVTENPPPDEPIQLTKPPPKGRCCVLL